MRCFAMFARPVLCIALLAPMLANAADLVLHHVGGERSLAWELVGPKAVMTDFAIAKLALRACPKGYQSDNGVEFAMSDGRQGWRFSFFCLDPAAEASPEAAGRPPAAAHGWPPPNSSAGGSGRT